MIFLITSIICSVSVGILFKLLNAKSTVNIYLININYLCAIAATYFIFEPVIDLSKIHFSTVIPLSILLPGIFWIMTIAIKNNGIIKTDIAQRISLIIPAICSFWLFQEEFSWYKVLGIIVGLSAMFFIINNNLIEKKTSPIYLLFVFFGFGIIDVLFKITALNNEIPYTTTLFYIFCGSFFVTTFLSITTYKKEKIAINLELLFNGILLGILNFMNIYFYMKAHQYYATNPITVFACMNFGVIFMGTLIGKLIFKEKMSAKNIFGLFLALIAISLIIIGRYSN